MPSHAPTLDDQTAQLPLVVDLDGTLLVTDTLDEQFAASLFRNPLHALACLTRLLEGRVAFKKALASEIDFSAAEIPLREDLVAWLREQAQRGRDIHLCSAADQSVVDALAARLGFFTTATGTRSENLKGATKATFLAQTFPDGFVYVGDAAADIPVWQQAQGIVLAGANGAVSRAARRLGKPIEAEFSNQTLSVSDVFKALRIHHWSKNALIFVPLLLAHALNQPAIVFATFLGFACLTLVTSATYLINDVSDIQADRKHWSKRKRAVAAGVLPIRWALIGALGAIMVGLAGALSLSPLFALALLFYLGLTLAYSLVLKRIPLLDTLVIGVLFTTRLIMGMTLLGTGYSEWLLAFSAFFFTSLAIAKRHAEIMRALGIHETQTHALASRGYRLDEAPLTLAFGVAIGVASLLIMVLFLVEELFHRGTYTNQKVLLGVPLVLSIWIGRIWLLASRGEMHDDPVSFALRDRASLALGVAVIFLFVVAL